MLLVSDDAGTWILTSRLRYVLRNGEKILQQQVALSLDHPYRVNAPRSKWLDIPDAIDDEVGNK